MPAAPTPATALPPTKAVELGAAPQRAEAASNIKIFARRTNLAESNSVPADIREGVEFISDTRYVRPGQMKSAQDLAARLPKSSAC